VIYLVIKALVSGAIVATISEVAKRYPGLGSLIAAAGIGLGNDVAVA